MVRQALIAVMLSFLSMGCAATRVPAAQVATKEAPAEIIFARGILKTSSPGPAWIVRKDIVMRDARGRPIPFALMFMDPQTGSAIAVSVYGTDEVSPMMMADRMQTALRAGGAEVSNVDFSRDDRASFMFKVTGPAESRAVGKTVTIRLNDVVSVAVVGTLTGSDIDSLQDGPAGKSGRAAMESVVNGLAITPK